MGIRLRRPLLLGGGGKLTYTDRILSVEPANLIAYWPMWEATGTNADNYEGTAARDGTYTGVTLGQTGIGDGNTCPYFDGVNDYVDIYSASLNTAWDGNKGSLGLWAKVSAAGVWEDATLRYCGVLEGTAERVIIRRTAANNTLEWYRRGGGVTDLATIGGYSSTDWMHLVVTWDTTADELKAYYNGAQSGATQSTLGTWVSALVENTTNIGSASEAPANPWSGWLAHVAVWTKALTAAQILELATV